jgi:drug/metabolite transporter (DMT)-like permease
MARYHRRDAVQRSSVRRSSTHNGIECLDLELACSRSYRRRRSAHISRPLPLCASFGISTSLIGVIVIVTRGDLGVVTQLEFNFGDLIIVLAMAVFAIYVAYLRMRPPTHWLTFLFVLGTISAITTMPFAIFEIAQGKILELSLLTIFAALYVSISPSLLAFAAWNRGVELIGPNKAGPFLQPVPLYTSLLAGIFLAEDLRLFHVAGLLLTLTGVSLASGRTSVAR